MSISSYLRIACIAGLVALGLPFAHVGAVAQSLDELSFSKKLKLAKVGDEDAQLAVARAYEIGRQVKRNRLEAAKWYRTAAEQGNVEAQFRLGRLVHQGGDGLKQDLQMAAKLYESAAEAGNIDAQNWLGYSYQHGIGLEANENSALEWYQRAADAGHAAAQNNLGLMYLTGKGTSRNHDKAFEYFSKAAAQNEPWGLNNLGGMYEMGWGTAKDRARALELYKQAADLKNPPAKDNYQRLLALGEGKPAAASASAATSVEPAGATGSATRSSPGVIIYSQPGEGNSTGAGQ
jgi:TPR repeat protein